jgi:glutamyl-tRNA reductase
VANDTQLVLIGVNHRTAAVDVREKLNLAAAGFDGPLVGSVGPEHVSEIAALSTCNRLEIYYVGAGPAEGAEDAIVHWFVQASGLSPGEIRPSVYISRGREAVQHLLRVACGLDSQILGEAQILGQVGQCFVNGRAGSTVGPVLTYVLSRALHAGKRARAETGIAHGGTSISHAAASLLAREIGGISGKQVLVIGAGATAETALQALRKQGDPRVVCVGRSMTRAESLAATIGCEALPWSALGQALATADAVISATSAPHPILYAEDIVPLLELRGGKPLVLVDIAVPRDIDPGVEELPSVVLYDIDRLEATLDEGRAVREAAIPTVEQIVSEETEATMAWLRGRKVAPLIREFRQRARAVADAEARRAAARSGDLSPQQQEIVFQMARRIANKMLHEPTVRLRARAQRDDDERYLQAFREMFGLDSEAER